jgi:hypothetical protein
LELANGLADGEATVQDVAIESDGRPNQHPRLLHRVLRRSTLIRWKKVDEDVSEKSMVG